MKINCKKEDLLKSVILADKASGKNLNLPALKGILFKVSDKIFINATNVDLSLELEVQGVVKEKGSLVVDGSVLINLLSNIPTNENLDLEIKEKYLSVNSKNIKTNIPTLSKDDFPVIKKPITKEIISVKNTTFLNGLKSVWFSASNSNIKQELSSVYVYPEQEKIVFVATDSFRLSEKKIPLSNNLKFEPILIPIKNIPNIIKFLEDFNGDVEIYFEENQVSFISKNNFITSRIIDGNFPDYKQIIPKEFQTEITLLKEDLLNSLKISNVFADKFNQIIFKVDISKKSFLIHSKNQEKGENISETQAALEGDDIEIGFNYRYVMDAFQSISSDSLTLSLSGFGKPMIIKGVSDNSFIYMVMPMNK